jgi:hypothetical protein
MAKFNLLWVDENTMRFSLTVQQYHLRTELQCNNVYQAFLQLEVQL